MSVIDVNLKSDAMKSKLFGQATKSVVNLLATQDVTVNFHHQCATPENFTAHGLNATYRSLSLNYDPNSNIKYISSIEHKTYPFFGVQFHPEKNIYEWNTKEIIPHSPDAIHTAHYFAQFFVSQGKLLRRGIYYY
jgi:gamma-glutamyl hydrolase